jgi:hypothetical protein
LILGDALSSSLFNIGLEYAAKRVQKNQEGLKLNGARQLLSYADENIVRENIYPIQKNREALLDAGKDAVFDVNPVKTKYMLVPRYEKA